MGETYDQLDAQADGMPDGPARFDVRRRAANLADQIGDEGLTFIAQLKLATDGVNSAKFEEAFFAFTRFATIYDQNPDWYRQHRNLVLWFYGWSIGHICYYASVSRAQIEQTLDAYKRRLEEEGAGLGGWWQGLVDLGIHTGEDEAALRKTHANALETRHTIPALCHSCALNQDVELYAHLEDYDRLIKRATPAFEKDTACDSTPHITYSHVVLPAFQRGEPRADLWFERGYDLVKIHNRHISGINRHFAYAVATNKIDLALKMVQRHAAWAIDVRDDYDRLSFTIPAHVLFEKVGEDRREMKLEFPSTWVGYRADGVYEVDALIDWFKDESESTASAFDQRNGNDSASTRSRRTKAVLRGDA